MQFQLSFLLALLSLGAATTSGNASEKPDIILIMVDDMGFSDLGYMGGEIHTPNLDDLARGGVRFSQFHNSGRCCPTRATLMTGLHPHQTGIGWMTESPESKRGESEPPAYRGHLNRHCVTLAEVLGEAGYATLMAGKWHLGFNDRDDWPLQRGFEKFFGCIPGATRFFHPGDKRCMTLGNDPVENPESTTGEAFYTTDAFTDHAIRFLKEERSGKGRPAFLYLAYTAPHWPLQAFEDDIARYRGRYLIGWDQLREERFARQKELGLFPEETVLSPRTPGIPEWHAIDGKKRDEMDLKMAVYAAMVDRVDQNIGRLVAHLKESGTYENTLILFLSDNGACQEGGMLGRGEFYDVEKRNRQDSNSYGEAWANAGNTPFRLYKHFAHEGGTSTPFFMHWPAAIGKQDDWFTDPAQLIDIMPTLLDAAGAKYPERDDLPKLDGRSLRPAFTGETIGREEPIFIEHETNASLRDGNWKLVGKGVATQQGTDHSEWELYDMAKDRTETLDLAAAHPEKVAELAAKWEAWAERVEVYPRGEKSPKPPAPKAERKPPFVRGRAFTVHATVDADAPDGVVLAHGGVRFGYSLAFIRGKPAFFVRNEGKLTKVIADRPFSGELRLRAHLDRESMSLGVDGAEVARIESPGLLSDQPGLGLYLGLDFRDAVGDYEAPNRFNGQLISHRIDLAMPEVTMRTRWGKEVTPENAWTEYPRPQLRRDQWTNLNGHWDYAVIDGQEAPNPPEAWDGKILVPFPIESPLSGVEKPFLPEQTLWYRRTFSTGKKDGRRYRLNFEAVDYESTVWVNGREVGSHTGGNLPFHFDITDALRSGENTIVLRVTDATDTAYQLHGKQRLNPSGIWYTPVSGIWQTVWMEEVPDLHVTGLKMIPKIDGTVDLAIGASESFEGEVSVTASLGGKEVASAKGPADGVVLTIPDPQRWSPDSPTLYDLTIRLGDDVVRSYTGLRETGLEKDARGHWRFTLNGEPLFHWGTLDQGWWPDGLLSPPSDEAMRWDIEFLKKAGFNTIRKHIKVEPRRYYHHCDRLGMLVWQDQVSADPPRVEWPRLAPHPPRARWPDDAHRQFMAELKTMIDTLHNHPSIVQWVPFNERWGQHQTVEVGEWAVAHDPTRQINIASGGNFFPVGHIVDAHNYPHPSFPWHHGKGGRFDDFVKVIGEFGGHGFPVEGHLWSRNTRNWGYGGLPENKEEWLERYRESIRRLVDLKKQGIAAGIYTQTTDVEGEINGLVTYDREVMKIPPGQLEEIAAPLFAPDPGEARDSRPNIVSVFIDDMGFTDLSCFGGEKTVTENIDRLAAEGIRFTQFYVNSPICSPSRTALTTGQYPQRWRIGSYLSNRNANRSRGMAQWLDPRAPVLARELQRSGYATGHFGKWHMGGQRDVGEAPMITAYGFDESLTNFEGLGPRVLGFKNAFKGGKPKLHGLGSDTLGRGPIHFTDRHLVTPAFVDGALQFIDRAEERGQPFYVNLWPDDVHSPFFPPEKRRKQTDESKRELYYAVLDTMDRQLAPLFDHIRDSERLRKNTLVFLCSDNGHEHGAGMSDPLRGSKTWLYEGGIRSPLIVWGPGLIAEEAAGTTNDTSTFAAIDLNRSLYALTGTPLPEGHALDGENVIGTILGRSRESRESPLFFRRPPDRPGFSQGSQEDNPDLAVRHGKWKFLVNYDGSDPQLYDLEIDAPESRNLAGDHPDVVERLKKALFDWNAALPADAGDPAYRVQ